MRSIVAASATPSPSIRSDSSEKGRARRLATKPGLSLARIGVRPIRSATSVVAASASSEERSAATTSTSFISAGGLKKCMPTTRSGCGTPSAIAATRSEEVLLAKTGSGPSACARPVKISRFSSSFSGAASIDQLAAAQLVQLGRGLDPRGGGLGVVDAPAPALGAFVERLPQRLGAGLGQRRGDVVEHRLVAAQRRQLGDPAAHRPGAEDADPADGHRPLKSGSRFSMKAVIPSTRSSVAIASSNIRRSASSPSLSAVSSAVSTACLARRAAIGGRSAIVRASSTASTSQSPVLDDLVDQPPGGGHADVEVAAGQHVLHRPLLADRPGQALGAAAAGDDPQGDLGLAEADGFVGDDHVAGHGQLAAAAAARSRRRRRRSGSGPRRSGARIRRPWRRRARPERGRPSP